MPKVSGRQKLLNDNLRIAAINGNIEGVKVAIKDGANVNAVDPNNGTALVDAASRNYVEIVNVLLDNKADVNVATYPNRMTALMYASNNGYTEIVRALLDKNADVERRNWDGNNAINFARENSHGKILTLLESHLLRKTN